jgi:hypothetical protein
MSTCPRCQQTVISSAILCPSCNLELKAHGHVGIPLHRSQGREFLCTTCTYEVDDSCTYPQRPFAQECSMYRDVNKPSRQPVSSRSTRPGTRAARTDPRPAWRVWLQDSPAGLILLGVLGLAIWLVLKR